MSRRLICTMNVSLDGYGADRDGSLGWAEPDAELFRFVTEETSRLSAYVMGRRLYETMLYWETVDQASLDDDARAWAAVWLPLPKLVFSTTLTAEAMRGTARLATGSLAEELERLDGDVAIGGPGLAAAAARAGLLDEFQPRVIPVLVGGGLSFYPDLDEPLQLEAVESRAFASGTVAHRYRVKR